jgi:hypothetical protein
VADGVAKVEEHPVLGVQFVLLNNYTLYITANIQNGFDITRDSQAGGMSCQVVKKGGVGNAAIFDDLRHAVGKGLVIQGVQRVRVHEHQLGLPKGPSQIFAVVQVHRHLAAHRGIHLGEQGRGNLDEVHPTQDGSGGKACQVSHHAAAQGDHRVGAGEGEVHHVLPQRGEL